MHAMPSPARVRACPPRLKAYPWVVVLEDFLKLVDRSVYPRSGGVMYSGRSAFSEEKPFYLLGLNPAGDPRAMARETVENHMTAALGRPAADWSEYLDVSWGGHPAGMAPMQRRVQHLLRALGQDPRRVPASNVVFVRAKRESYLEHEKDDLLRACWPVHDAVISSLRVRAVICMGRTAGQWVREQLGAHTQKGTFVEQNARHWESVIHADGKGLYVATLTHPSIAAWDVPATDPSPLLKALL